MYQPEPEGDRRPYKRCRTDRPFCANIFSPPVFVLPKHSSTHANEKNVRALEGGMMAGKSILIRNDRCIFHGQVRTPFLDRLDYTHLYTYTNTCKKSTVQLISAFLYRGSKERKRERELGIGLCLLCMMGITRRHRQL